MSKIETLVKDNEHLYPRTVEKAIYDDNGVRLDNKIGELRDTLIGQITTSHTLRNNSGVIYRIGRICNVFVNIQLTSDVNAYTTFANVHEGFVPLQTICGADEDLFTGVEIDINGNLKFTKSLPSGKVIVFAFTYICKE